MGKYENKLITDYIKGNDIIGYNIDELENDYEFMSQVINQTNDKKMYNFCSEELKKDYRLVKYMVKKFRGDLEYICLVADNFIESTQNETQKIELLLIMDKYMSRKEKHNKYNVQLSVIYFEKRLELEMYKATTKDEKINNELGMGFLLMFDTFNHNELVTNFFAEKTVNAIFSEFDINLEEYLHKNYDNFENIEKQGINVFLLNFISMYDKMLSSYISTRINLLSPLISQMNKIKLNWNNYNKIRDYKICSMIVDEVSRYMEPYQYKINYFEIQLLYYVAFKLGISDKIKEYEKMSDEDCESLINSVDEDNLLVEDKYHIKNIEEIILNCINGTFTKQNSKANIPKREIKFIGPKFRKNSKIFK